MIVTHDENRHMVWQVVRGGGPQSTSVSLWKNFILRDDKEILLEKWFSGWSVKSSKNDEDPFYCLMRAFQRCWRFIKPSYSLVAMGDRKIMDFSMKGRFPSNLDSFAKWFVVNLERRKGPKYCGDCSRQTNHQNQDLQLSGRWPYSSLQFQWFIS